MEKSWVKILDFIKNQISSANFKAWFAKTTCEIEDNKLIIFVPSAFVKQTMVSKYQPLISDAIKSVLEKDYTLDFKIDPSLTTESTPDEIDFDFPPLIKYQQNSGVNPRYTLENFMVGLSNNLAYAAVQAVVQNPGISYNPLFIYGGTGVGKTHLMHAVGNSLYKKNPNLKIIYCALERFMNDFIESIQTKRMGEFRAKYRNCDLFLIDDVQFISGRDSTQEEFFHTFNDLQAKNSQVILTSDRPPSEIQKLEGRLASRFQGGLMVDIQLPDFDTRVAILKEKSHERGENIPEEILTLIAENMATNARELEGRMIQLIQSFKSSNQPLTIETVSAFLGNVQPKTNGGVIDYKKVLSSINQYFNIKMLDMTGPKRKKGLVLPRQLAMFILYQECKLPYEKIGDILGGRDHTTIMHGVGKIGEAIGRDREIQRMLIEIKQSLQ